MIFPPSVVLARGVEKAERNREKSKDEKAMERGEMGKNSAA